MIEMKKINKYYKMGESTLRVLNDIDLTINDHEFVSIIGPSGSGKSTLMNILGCLDTADSGEYFLEGEDILKSSEKHLTYIRNKYIGFIFQSFNLLQKLSALENVELPLIYQGVSTSERKERAFETLKSVGLGDRIHHKPTELSGGQQQRVAIARALVTKPALILADEPTGNLDSKSGTEVMELLHNLHDEGNTIVLITHDKDVALQAERQVTIKDGIISDGQVDVI